MSQAHKDAIRKALLGRKITWGDKISAARIGIQFSDETREKMSVAKKGKPGRAISQNEKDHLRQIHLGRKASDETRAKMSAAKVGKPGPWIGIERGPQSAEWRRKISQANKGRPAYYPKRRFYYRGIPFRSSWEVIAAKAFDRIGIVWEFETKQFELDEFETYRPDFFLPELGCYWEVKGYFGPQSKHTIELFRERYPDIPLIVATASVLKLLDRGVHPRLRL